MRREEATKRIAPGGMRRCVSENRSWRGLIVYGPAMNALSPHSRESQSHGA